MFIGHEDTIKSIARNKKIPFESRLKILDGQIELQKYEEIINENAGE